MMGAMKDLHPVTCFLYYILSIILTMLFFHPIYQATILIGCGLLCLLQLGGKPLVRSLLFMTITGLSVLILNPLFTHRGETVLFFFWYQPVTEESIMYGFTMALSLMSIFVIFLSFNHVITPGKFLFVFNGLFQQTGMLAMLAVRFVPLLNRRLGEITVIQRSKGIDPMIGSLQKRLRDAMLLLQVLLTVSLSDALQTADAMKARGYGLIKRRGMYQPYSFTHADFYFLGLSLFFFLVCIGGWMKGFGVLTIYPILDTIRLKSNEWLIYSSLVLFLLVPVVCEGRETWRWHY
jgi:energy-coupling factor transport system permease protein